MHTGPVLDVISEIASLQMVKEKVAPNA